MPRNQALARQPIAPHQHVRPELHRYVVRFQEDPSSPVYPGRDRAGGVDASIEDDSLVGHLNNAIMMLQTSPVERVDVESNDAGELAVHVTLTLETVQRCASRLRRVVDELKDAIEYQEMLDTTSRADNFPF